MNEPWNPPQKRNTPSGTSPTLYGTSTGDCWKKGYKLCTRL